MGGLWKRKTWRPRGKTASTNYCPSGRADVINHSCDLVRSKIHYFTYFISCIHKFLKKINSPALWLGNRKVFQVIFDILGVRTEISTAHSSLIFSRVLPSKVLLSPLAKLAKYLMLDFLEEERESANFTNLLERNVFGWAQPDTLSMKYLCVVQGRLNTFLTVTFQDL